jgi:hypothetical protein
MSTTDVSQIALKPRAVRRDYRAAGREPDGTDHGR